MIKDLLFVLPSADRPFFPSTVLVLARGYGYIQAKRWSQKETSWYTPDPIEFLDLIDEYDAPAELQAQWTALMDTAAGEDLLRKDLRFIAYLDGWNEYRYTHPMEG